MQPWRPNRKRGIPAVRRKGFYNHFREFIWPSMGLCAMGRWAWLKLLRQAHQPHYVARGAALGVVVSFFPILGTHTLLIVLFSYVLSASFVAAMLTSMLANPWTLPFMWTASHKVGAMLMGAHMHPVGQMRFDILEPGVLMRDIPDMLESVILPTIIGGFAIAIPLAMLVYVLVYWRLSVRHAIQQS